MMRWPWQQKKKILMKIGRRSNLGKLRILTFDLTEYAVDPSRGIGVIIDRLEDNESVALAFAVRRFDGTPLPVEDLAESIISVDQS